MFKRVMCGIGLLVLVLGFFSLSSDVRTVIAGLLLGAGLVMAGWIGAGWSLGQVRRVEKERLIRNLPQRDYPPIIVIQSGTGKQTDVARRVDLEDLRR